MNNKRIIVLSLVFVLYITATGFSQQIKAIEFRDQQITDILLVLAEISGKSIIPDETVISQTFRGLNDIFNQVHEHRLFFAEQAGGGALIRVPGGSVGPQFRITKTRGLLVMRVI